jgi:hypothetical protein
MTGVGLGIELFILASALIIITIWIVCKFNSDNESFSKLKKMVIYFTISYGLRSVYLFFYGHYSNVVKDDNIDMLI